MKYIIGCILLNLAVANSYAQQMPTIKLKSSAKHLDSILDTTQLYPSRYGNVARLTLDNMPCILPYKPAKPIPNKAEKKGAPNEIPNLWPKREKK